MYLVLLGFGLVLSIAGIVLMGAGMSLRDGTFDASLFTPGIVAAVGGLLLIGLGLALRTLQEIERALAARPMPRVAQAPIAPAVETSDEPGEAVMFAFPSQAKQEPAVAGDASDDEPALAVAEKAPDTRSFPPTPKPAAPASAEANAETDADHFASTGNGAAASRVPPRLPIGARSTATERSQSFETAWRKGPRSVLGIQTGPVPNSGTPAT